MDVRMIAHDMRTPLNALNLSLMTAAKMAEGKPELVELLAIAKRNATAVAGMVESLLATNAHDPFGKGPLNLRQCRPVDLVASAIDQVTPLASARSQKIASEDLGSLPEIVADGERLIRVLVNLLSNAIKFTPEAGAIFIDAKPRSNDGHHAMVFSVIDEGNGVSKEDAERIFQPGVSIAQPGKYSTGLGLAVCKEIVEAHGGNIWVEMDRKKGAAFSFSIPRRSDEQQEEEGRP